MFSDIIVKPSAMSTVAGCQYHDGFFSHLIHDKENQRFTLDINGEIAKVDYTLREPTMYSNYSDVPYNLRGQGIGKVLVEKTFEQLTKEGYKAVAVCSYIKTIASRSKKWNKIIS